MNKITVATDFTDAPWPRYIKDGNFSWEAFYKDKIKPKLDQLINKWEKKKLVIDLDWTYWYSPSFLSEAFGRLYSENKNINVWDYIELISKEDLSLIESIKQYMQEYGS